MKATWTWLSEDGVIMLHDQELVQTGGHPGLRDRSLLDSALSRPLHRASYEHTVDAADLGITYASGIIRNHPFYDGNKRTAMLSLATFLDINGWLVDIDDDECAKVMVSLAARQTDEEEATKWVRQRLKRDATFQTLIL